MSFLIICRVDLCTMCAGRTGCFTNTDQASYVLAQVYTAAGSSYVLYFSTLCMCCQKVYVSSDETQKSFAFGHLSYDTALESRVVQAMHECGQDNCIGVHTAVLSVYGAVVLFAGFEPASAAVQIRRTLRRLDASLLHDWIRQSQLEWH